MPVMSVSVQFRVRLIATLLEPALRVAHRLCIPADELVDLLLTEYVRHQIEAGFSFTAISRRIGKSRRKVAYLAKAAKSPSNLVEDSEHFALRRQVASWLAEQEGHAADESELERAFALLSDASRGRAVEALVDSGVLDREGVTLRLSAAFMSTVDSDPGPLIDAVRNLARALSTAVEHRSPGRRTRHHLLGRFRQHPRPRITLRRQKWTVLHCRWCTEVHRNTRA